MQTLLVQIFPEPSLPGLQSPSVEQLPPGGGGGGGGGGGLPPAHGPIASVVTVACTLYLPGCALRSLHPRLPSLKKYSPTVGDASSTAMPASVSTNDAGPASAV